MGESPMVGETVDLALEAAENVQVRGFGGQRHRGRGQRGFPVETGTPQAGAGQEVGDRFQSFSFALRRDVLEYIEAPILGFPMQNFSRSP